MTETKHREAKKGHGWIKLEKIGLHLGKFEKRRPIFFQICVSLYQNIIYTYSGKIILSCYVALILQMKDQKTLALLI